MANGNGNKAIEILNKRLANMDAEIATAENNVRVSTNKLNNLKKIREEVTKAVATLTAHLPV